MGKIKGFLFAVRHREILMTDLGLKHGFGRVGQISLRGEVRSCGVLPSRQMLIGRTWGPRALPLVTKSSAFQAPERLGAPIWCDSFPLVFTGQDATHSALVPGNLVQMRAEWSVLRLCRVQPRFNEVKALPWVTGVHRNEVEMCPDKPKHISICLEGSTPED